jgi:hypothetical protein
VGIGGCAWAGPRGPRGRAGRGRRPGNTSDLGPGGLGERFGFVRPGPGEHLGAGAGRAKHLETAVPAAAAGRVGGALVCPRPRPRG